MGRADHDVAPSKLEDVHDHDKRGHGQYPEKAPGAEKVHEGSGGQVFRWSGIQVVRYSGGQVFRCSGIQVFRYWVFGIGYSVSAVERSPLTSSRRDLLLTFSPVARDT